MSKRKNRNIVKRLAIDIAGFGLILISPFLGWLPGPGGIPVFLAGLGILALNYDWAENLLKDFDRRRIEFVETYLVGNKKVSRTIDLLCISIMAMAAIAFIFLDNTLLRILSAGAGSFSFFILILNQRRFDRMLARIKGKRSK